MRIAYLDCASGISGDMTLGALVDAGVDLATLQAGIDSLGLPSCRLVASEVKKKGFRATQIVVEHEPEHAHRHLHHITEMIDRSTLTDRQKQLAGDIFLRLAKAEAKVHGSTIEKVHFHEVGAVDSIADIVGAAIGWDLLGVDRVVASPIPTGTGFIEIAHGRCAIPAPATAELLAGVPLADFAPEGELTTPTGAAIVTTLTSEFGPVPAMTIETIGLGAGQKDFDHANVLRLLVGETAGAATGVETDKIVLLETNLDDTPGEQIGHCVDALWQAGAVDVSLTPLQMKKNRPGVLLAVQCPQDKADVLESIVFRETTTLGLRRQLVERRILPRRQIELETPLGTIQGMVAQLPDGAERFSAEYESCRQAAEQSGAKLADVYAAAATAYAAQSKD
ncbi:nickel pincer cofactor biosynthesis protein LarC [Aeoliella sp.]|uniref:nickel pincer cofactor biosynthesis protein LarC n=1 Tax=Aeoliella sp. TaxID=2795800 RepID=UPI003CCBFCA7